MKTSSPLNHDFLSEKDSSIDQIRRSPRGSFAPPDLQVRNYFRALRMAELRAWEISGGDYLISNKRLSANCPA
jgi:hypothetical protein